MKLTTSILTVTAAMMTSGAWAQNPNIINNVQSSMNTVQAQKTSDSNAALEIPAKPAAAQSAKPAAPIKPAAAQPAKPAASQPANTAATATAKPKPATVTPATAKPATSATAAPGKSPFVAVKASAKPQVDPMVNKKPASHAVIVAKEPTLQVVSKTASPDGKNAADAKAAGAVKPIEAPKPPKPEEKKWAMSGKRDPFFSPVVQQPTGSGCSTGKKCLDIGQINLRGVVRSEGGFIAVVTNSLNKAYFLHENDPVFNGYVMKITGDSVVFSESGQDKLGKPLTREVVKKITTPAV